MEEEKNLESDADISVEEEFRNIHADATGMQEKYRRLAVAAHTAQQPDHGAAMLLEILAEDVLPLIKDAVAATAAFSVEVQEGFSELLEEDGEEVGSAEEGAPGEEGQILVSQVDVEALYRLSHVFQAYLEVLLAKGVFKSKAQVRQTTESLLNTIKGVVVDGQSKHGISPDAGLVKFRTDLEASFK